MDSPARPVPPNPRKPNMPNTGSALALVRSSFLPCVQTISTVVQGGPRRILHALRADSFLLILVTGLIVLSLIAPTQIASYPALVDWPTIAALTGLLTLTKGLEVSGSLHRVGNWLVGFMATERTTALSLVMAAMLLSTVLTNDVALFVVIPLTLGVCRIAQIPATRLIIFEALAVNAGSALTPIGNPQNLFLWQLSHVSFGRFVMHMLPLVAMTMLILILLTAFVFSARPMQVRSEEKPVALDRLLLGISLVLYLPFLLATDLHYANWAVCTVLLVFLIFRLRVLAQIDWGLLAVFVLMFVDLRLLAHLKIVSEVMDGLGLAQASHLYLASIAASQMVSNVPAAIALSEYSSDWQVISYGVNIGGFGFMLGSIANLIALRMSGDRRAWLSFHAYAIPFLGIAAVLGYALLSRGHAL